MSSDRHTESHTRDSEECQIVDALCPRETTGHLKQQVLRKNDEIHHPYSPTKRRKFHDISNTARRGRYHLHTRA